MWKELICWNRGALTPYFFHFHSVLRRWNWVYLYFTLSWEIQKCEWIRKLSKKGWRSIRIELRDRIESIYQRFGNIGIRGPCINEMNFVLWWRWLQFKSVLKHFIPIYQIQYELILFSLLNPIFCSLMSCYVQKIDLCTYI